MPKKQVADIKVTRLENGVMVATETLPKLHSASLGVYLDVGSRDENARNNGLAHLFEHMVFKGTGGRSALDLVKAFEACGGHVNAFTSKEQTCFYGKVTGGQAVEGMDILLDMSLNALFDPCELRKEKDVIIEEIKGGNDNPEDFVHDLFSRAYFGDHSLGFPIAGTEKTVTGLTEGDLDAHRALVRARLPVYVVAVGRVSHADMVRTARRSFALPARGNGRVRLRRPPARVFRREPPRHLAEYRNVQQVTAVLGGPAYGWNDSRRFPLILLNSILGDGMSSRLFQSLREELGLVYTIYSSPEFLVRTGVFTVGFATEPGSLGKAMQAINREFSRLKREGLSAGELDFAKANVRGGVLLSLESTYNRMSHIARRLMSQEKESLERTLERLEKVTLKDMNRCIRETFSTGDWATAAIAPKNGRVNLGAQLDF